MKSPKHLLLFILLLFAGSSCKKEAIEAGVTEANGEIWLSGGLYHCAQQLRLDTGPTLVVSLKDVITFRSGDKITVKYKPTGSNKNCTEYTDCEIIEIRRL